MAVHLSRPSCPDCSSRDVVPILYGLVANPEPGVILGGCIFDDDKPQWGCRTCGRHFSAGA